MTFTVAFRKIYKVEKSWINMETVTIPKVKYIELKRKAEIDEELLIKLIKGLEDIKHGRVKEWKKSSQ